MLVVVFHICFSCHLSIAWQSNALSTIRAVFMRRGRSVFKVLLSALSTTPKLQGTVHTNAQGANNSLWLHILRFMSVYTCNPPTMSKTIKSLRWITLCHLSARLDRSLGSDIVLIGVEVHRMAFTETPSPIWICKHYTLGMENCIAECKPPIDWELGGIMLWLPWLVYDMRCPF